MKLEVEMLPYEMQVTVDISQARLFETKRLLREAFVT